MTMAIQDASATAAPKKVNWYPYILIAPTFVTLIVVSLVPFIYAVYLSLHEARYGVVKDFVWFDNYIQLLKEPAFWNAMYVSGLFVLIAVPVQFMLGLGGALILNRGVAGRSLIVPLLFIPAMMAPVVVGLLWKIMLAGSWGVLSYNVVERFNIVTESSIFGSPHYALYALIFIDIWQWTPFMMLAFFAGLQALPPGPYRAASVDGAGPFRTFFKLTLPLMAAGWLWGAQGVVAAAGASALVWAGLASLAWLYCRVRGRDGFGGGDVKCLAALAGWLGWEAMTGILWLACVLGLAWALVRRGGWHRSYPFGPCIALAAGAWLLAWMCAAGAVQS